MPAGPPNRLDGITTGPSGRGDPSRKRVCPSHAYSTATAPRVTLFFFSSRRRHTRCSRDWSSDVCSSDLPGRLGPSNGTHAGRLLCAAPTPGQPRRGAARLWKCASSVLLVVLVLVLVSIVVLGQLPRSADLDVAAERLELEPGAPRAEREVETVLGLSRQLHGEAGTEVAVERRDGH